MKDLYVLSSANERGCFTTFNSNEMKGMRGIGFGLNISVKQVCFWMVFAGFSKFENRV